MGTWQVRPWGDIRCMGCLWASSNFVVEGKINTYLLSYISFCTYAQSCLVALNYTGAVCQNCFPKAE